MSVASVCNGFINCSSDNIVYNIINTGTTTTTGSIFLTLIMIFIMLLLIALMFGIPLEFTAILVLPLMFGYMAYFSEFLSMGLVMLIYLAIIFTKNFIIC